MGGSLDRHFLSSPWEYRPAKWLIWKALNVAFQRCMTCHIFEIYVSSSEQKPKKFAIPEKVGHLFKKGYPKFKIVPFWHRWSDFDVSYHFEILHMSTCTKYVWIFVVIYVKCNFHNLKMETLTFLDSSRVQEPSFCQTADEMVSLWPKCNFSSFSPSICEDNEWSHTSVAQKLATL